MLNAIKQVIFQVVQTTSRWPVKNVRADRIAAVGAIITIKIYRLLLSPLVGGDCLFRPTCSKFAQQAFGEHGWTRGSTMVRHRLNDCAGGYSLFMSAEGTPKMRARSGDIFELKQMSPAMIDKAQLFSSIAPHLNTSTPSHAP
jgi:putative component of membrane protein insertase Oxa1/YidC/SpoIIIJ protein YidD